MVGHAKYIVALVAERDRLAAENAELRESAAFYGNKFSHDIEQADRRSSQWERCFRLAFGLKQKYFSELATANAAHAKLVIDYEQVLGDLEASDATLSALRDLCGPNKTISNSTCTKMVDILYPQPKETTDDER